MALKIGMLTSGGDCQGLNAVLRGIAKSLYHMVPGVELYGIRNGYQGLIERDWCELRPSDFSGILRQGGTILGTSRQPYKSMIDKDDPTGLSEKAKTIIANAKEFGFDAIAILGGNGTQKTANLLSENGINVVGLPKTIDNDLWGTDLTFGFDSAVLKATSVIDSIHTTAEAHGRVFVIELMGHKVGWISLYAGMAGGADVILLPELPYDLDSVIKVIDARTNRGKKFSIIVIAEGAYSTEEMKIPRKKRENLIGTSGARLRDALANHIEQDVKLVIPGYYQRGGEPTPTDRLLCTRFGSKAASMIVEGRFGEMVSMQGRDIASVPLAEVAGKLKTIELDSDILVEARLLGIHFGDS
ncbi:MAG: ATP-dependent 6-phosphofructokinase [Clostridiales Family XIII bacterium]|jgi:6-phosphofructokinase 1|nr:ATP-dependent 6-phosphofructokinase [Clostridiales Family XIII bacterium]